MKNFAIAVLLVSMAIAMYVIYGALTGNKGVMAICMDGTGSLSKSRQGTCSKHGGVAKWVRDER